MLNRVRFIVVFLLLAVSLPSYSQKVTFSPYSRYGIGDIYTPAIGNNISMGYSGIGRSSEMYLNLLNPAGNADLPLQRFIFDVGMDTKYTTVSSSTASQKNNNTTFKYLAGGFAAKPWWSFAFALRPYSAVGYTMQDTTILEGPSSGTYYGYIQELAGSGGLNKVSLSTSFDFLNMFSFGATGSYLWGSLDRNVELATLKTDSYSSTTTYNNRYIITGFQYEFGVLAQKSIRSRKDSTKTAVKFSVGATIGTDAKLNSRNELLLTNVNNLTSLRDTICNDTIAKGKVTIPQKIGFGASVELFNRFTFTADYTMQDWKNFDIEGENHTPLRMSKYFGGGVEYVTDRYSSRFFKTIMYRAGFHTEDTYLELNGTAIKNQGVTFGLGLPLRTILLNVACDMGKRVTTDNNLYQEKYFLMHFNVTIHDVWFVKRKFQ